MHYVSKEYVGSCLPAAASPVVEILNIDQNVRNVSRNKTIIKSSVFIGSWVGNCDTVLSTYC